MGVRYRPFRVPDLPGPPTPGQDTAQGHRGQPQLAYIGIENMGGPTHNSTPYTSRRTLEPLNQVCLHQHQVGFMQL